MKLVVEREKEIKSFDPKEYWEIEINIKHKDRNIVFKLNTKKSELNLSNEQQANELIEKLLKAELLICLLYTSPSPRDRQKPRMPSSA